MKELESLIRLISIQLNFVGNGLHLGWGILPGGLKGDGCRPDVEPEQGNHSLKPLHHAARQGGEEQLHRVEGILVPVWVDAERDLTVSVARQAEMSISRMSCHRHDHATQLFSSLCQLQGAYSGRVNRTSVELPEARRAVAWVFALNLIYFFIEFTAATLFSSVSLLADSIDFLEDSALNLLILVGIGWTLAARVRLSRVLALMMLIPVVSAGWLVVEKILSPEVPEAGWMTGVGVGALAVNVGCAILMSKYRETGSGVLLAAFFSARNDALANLGIIIAGLVTLFWASFIPDLVVGLAIMALNLDASWNIWRGGRAEAKNLEDE